jgi:hypothetical protein
MSTEARQVERQQRALAVTLAAAAVLTLSAAGPRSAVALNDAERGHVPGNYVAGPADAAVLLCPSDDSRCVAS